ncbi:MAG TPA: HAD-IA family hydrolase [Thermoanaerobaculia bacterium]|nr:HAD-IA family hydrolase [Thermoanaerobaculia bacterium]
MSERLPVRGLRAVTFDVTGTLIHAPRLAEVYAEVLQHHRVPVTAADVARMFPEVYREQIVRSPAFVDRFAEHPGGARGWWGDLVCRLCQRLGAPEPSPFALAELYQRFERAEAWEVFADVPGSLDALRACGYRLGVISNWDERLPHLLRNLGLASRFEVVVRSSEVGLAKPHPAIFQRALDALGLAADQVVHVGDQRLEDLEGARGAGLHALLLHRRRGDDGALRALADQLCGGRSAAATARTH